MLSVYAITVTTDVQNATTRIDGKTIVITCTFAAGSLAKGCHVSATLRRTKPHQINIARNDNAAVNASGMLMTDCAADCYMVVACDWEEDGSIGEVCIPAYKPQDKLAERCDEDCVPDVPSEPG